MNQRTPVFLLAALVLTACAPEPEVTEPDVAPVTEETRSQPNLLPLVADDMIPLPIGVAQCRSDC